MNAADPASTGAPLTSTFHQLSGGKRGSGPGRAPPCTGPRHAAPTGMAAISAAKSVTTPIHAVRSGPSARALRRRLIKRLPLEETSGRSRARLYPLPCAILTSLVLAPRPCPVCSASPRGVAATLKLAHEGHLRAAGPARDRRTRPCPPASAPAHRAD